MSKPPEQLYLADDLQPPPDPVRTPAMDERVHAWLDSKDEARRMAEKRKDNEHLLLVACVERGLERYPYTDSSSGKTRYFVPDRTPKAKTIAAPAPKKTKQKHANVETAGQRVDAADAELAKLNAALDKRAAKAKAESERVESRRVPRASVAEEIGEADGFKDLRARMTETEH